MTKGLGTDNRINSEYKGMSSFHLDIWSFVALLRSLRDANTKGWTTAISCESKSTSHLPLHLFSLFPVDLGADDKRTCDGGEELQNLFPSPHHFTKHHFRTQSLTESFRTQSCHNISVSLKVLNLAYCSLLPCNSCPSFPLLSCVRRCLCSPGAAAQASVVTAPFPSTSKDSTQLSNSSGG